MKVNVFINDRSLEGQFEDMGSAKSAVLSLLRNIDSFRSSLADEVAVYYDTQLFIAHFTVGRHLWDSVLKDKDLREKYLKSKERNWRLWSENRLHDVKCSYKYNGMEYVQTSVAESFEYTAQYAQDLSLLLNFDSSSFTSPVIAVVKGIQILDVASVSKDLEIDKVLQLHSLIAPKYDNSSAYPPRDCQTVLANTELFIPTCYYNHHRRVFERIGKNEYWCVDNFHTNGSAHLEIFSKTDGKFKGTCRIDDVEKINSKIRKRDKGKVIDLVRL